MGVLKTTKFLLLFSLVSVGCYYDVEEEIYASVECDTLDMSYAQNIVPMMESDCYECHRASANFGNVTLEGYEQILKYVQDGSLVGVIRHDGGYSPMPKTGAKLLDCEIEKIEAWIADGALNN